MAVCPYPSFSLTHCLSLSPPSHTHTHLPTHTPTTKQDKLKATWDTSSWEAVYPQDIPRQQNGYDCGVFALMFCNRMAMKGGFFDFLQSDISVNIRAAITCDLLDGAIKATGSKQP